ncbi:MAG: chorismate mutase [Candidatus Peregrinibacteria bacterium]|nr:chorismate mutase [Candidatus Peregrinibacteria bacterium]
MFGKDTRDMTVAYDIRGQLTKLDQQIIDLLAQRAALYQEAMDEDEEGATSALADSLSFWEEEADEHGWSTAVANKICRSLHEICKTAE